MIGYKAFHGDMTCKNMQYKIGGTYKMDNKPVLCHTGFHFCTELGNVLSYYNRDARVCKVEAIGDIDTAINTNKYCTNQIKILSEIEHPFDNITCNLRFANPNLVKNNIIPKDIQIGQVLFTTLDGNNFICISKQKNVIICAFEKILGCSNIYGIDEWLIKNWNNVNIMPVQYWTALKEWFIPSEYEVFGSWTWGKPDDEPYLPFEYYRFKKNREKKYINGDSSSWWERSSSEEFRAYVGRNGVASYWGAALHSHGVVPAFVFEIEQNLENKKGEEKQ